MIVHRRLDTFDRRARISTWLFGICMRVAANYRRRRRWTARGAVGRRSRTSGRRTLTAADDILVRREQREMAERALDRLEVAKRATFVMFEIESLSCQEIAELMTVPVGTVYSRLHSARKAAGESDLRRDRKRGGLVVNRDAERRCARSRPAGASVRATPGAELMLRGARRPRPPGTRRADPARRGDRASAAALARGRSLRTAAPRRRLAPRRSRCAWSAAASSGPARGRHEAAAPTAAAPADGTAARARR